MLNTKQCIAGKTLVQTETSTDRGRQEDCRTPQALLPDLTSLLGQLNA